MGWRGYKGTIDVGMIFKKMYCKNCGTKLKIKKNTEIVKKVIKVIQVECLEKVML